MADIKSLLDQAIKVGASDIFIIAGLPLTIKKSGKQERLGAMLDASDTEEVIKQIYTLAQREPNIIVDHSMDDDFSFALDGVGRFRANVLHQRGTLAAVLRVIKFGLPNAADMHIPDSVLAVADKRDGLVLVTGPAGSGKSTTLACLIDRINENREGHIITLQDPIEYVHRHKKCIVTQREIRTDIPTYVDALRSALRESPDVILLGEMRDRDTMEVAMTAAETGELMFSTLHTIGAAGTVDRIIDSFPAERQGQMRMQLSMVLRAVVSQQLVPTVDGRRIPVFEIMHVNAAIRNLIRESKSYQIDAAIMAGANKGMCTMDESLLKLYKEGTITEHTVLRSCVHYEATLHRLGLIKGKQQS